MTYTRLAWGMHIYSWRDKQTGTGLSVFFDFFKTRMKKVGRGRRNTTNSSSDNALCCGARA